MILKLIASPTFVKVIGIEKVYLLPTTPTALGCLGTTSLKVEITIKVSSSEYKAKVPIS